MKLSLRGSLASQVAEHLRPGERHDEALGPFVTSLLLANDPDIEYRLEDDCMIVGRRSERGQYPPDW